MEVINAGATAVDLSGWRVAGPDSIWRYEFSGVLQPGNIAGINTLKHMHRPNGCPPRTHQIP